MISVSDIGVTINVDNETYSIDLAISFSGIRTSVYGKMYQYYMKTSGSQGIPIAGQDLLNDTTWESIANVSDGFFRFVFIQGEAYSDASTYSIGDLIYNVSSESFEKCITAVPTPKAYDSNDWESVNPEDSNINSSFKSVKDVLITQRSQKILINLREDSINSFIDSGYSDYNYGSMTTLKKVESLLQSAVDNFNDLSNKSLAQKYIEYIDIIA